MTTIADYKKPSNPRPHPLQDFVLRCIDERSGDGSPANVVIDVPILFPYLAGATFVCDGCEAYRTVCVDVLGHMSSRGLLTKISPGSLIHGGNTAHRLTRAGVLMLEKRKAENWGWSESTRKNRRVA